MPYEDRNKSGGVTAATGKNHSISMENRKKLSVSGVTNVESFDEHEIVVETVAGSLIIRGTDLSISKLNVDNGDINVQGEIAELIYDDTVPKQQSLWGRLFR